MVRKSGNRDRGRGFKIKEDAPKLTPIDLEKMKLESPDEGVSVSLKYFREETECFSEWQTSELKKFSGLIKKVGQLPSQKLKGYKPLCEPHKYPPAEGRFTRPATLSEDLVSGRMYPDRLTGQDDDR